MRQGEHLQHPPLSPLCQRGWAHEQSTVGRRLRASFDKGIVALHHPSLSAHKKRQFPEEANRPIYFRYQNGATCVEAYGFVGRVVLV